MIEQIKAYREKHQISQLEFCRRCGISRSLMYCMENKGREPTNLMVRGRIKSFLEKDGEK